MQAVFAFEIGGVGADGGGGFAGVFFRGELPEIDGGHVDEQVDAVEQGTGDALAGIFTKT